MQSVHIQRPIQRLAEDDKEMATVITATILCRFHVLRNMHSTAAEMAVAISL